MKRKLIEVSQENLVVCDNPSCDHKVPFTADKHDHLIHELINCPCPKCGENLLTEADYLQYMKARKTIAWINKWFSWIAYFYSKDSWENKRKSTYMKVHEGVHITNERNEH